MNARSVVVAHREEMVAEGLAAALRGYAHIVPIASVTKSDDAEKLGPRADAVAIDRKMPGAPATVRRLRRSGVRVVYIGEATEEGEVCVPLSASVSYLASALVPEARTRSEPPLLTSRQQEVLALLTKGLAAKQVARHLGISPKTVERHKTLLFARLGVTNQTAAVSSALQRGLGTSV